MYSMFVSQREEVRIEIPMQTHVLGQADGFAPFVCIQSEEDGSCVPSDTLPGRVWVLKSNRGLGSIELALDLAGRARDTKPVFEWTLDTSKLREALKMATAHPGMSTCVPCTSNSIAVTLWVAFNTATHGAGAGAGAWSWVFTFSRVVVKYGSPGTLEPLATVSWDVPADFIETFLERAFYIDAPDSAASVPRRGVPQTAQTPSDVMKECFFWAFKAIFADKVTSEWLPAPRLVGGNRTISLTASTESMTGSKKNRFIVEFDCTSGSTYMYDYSGDTVVPLESTKALNDKIETIKSAFTGLTMRQCFGLDAALFAPSSFEWSADAAGISVRFKRAIDALKAKMVSTQRRVKAMDDSSRPLTVAEVANTVQGVRLPTPGTLVVTFFGREGDVVSDSDRSKLLLTMTLERGVEISTSIMKASLRKTMEGIFKASEINTFLGDDTNIVDEPVGIVAFTWTFDSTGGRGEGEGKRERTAVVVSGPAGKVKVVSASGSHVLFRRKDLTKAITQGLFESVKVETYDKTRALLEAFKRSFTSDDPSRTGKPYFEPDMGHATLRRYLNSRDTDDTNSVIANVVFECAKACFGAQVAMVAITSAGNDLVREGMNILPSARLEAESLRHEVVLDHEELAAIMRVFDLENVKTKIPISVHGHLLMEAEGETRPVAEIVLAAYQRLRAVCKKMKDEGKLSPVHRRFFTTGGYPIAEKELVAILLRFDKTSFRPLLASNPRVELCLFWKLASEFKKSRFAESVVSHILWPNFPNWRLVHPEFASLSVDVWIKGAVFDTLSELFGCQVKDLPLPLFTSERGQWVVEMIVSGAKLAGVDAERASQAFPWPDGHYASAYKLALNKRLLSTAEWSLNQMQSPTV